MRINRKLLPIKAHFFFFMAAMGPILPQLPVYGKELGISSVVMGTVTGILPFAFLLTKPAFGLLVDVYRDYRKTIFMLLILTMTVSFGLMNFIPARPLVRIEFDSFDSFSTADTCNVTEIQEQFECNNKTTRVICTSNCPEESSSIFLVRITDSEPFHQFCSLPTDFTDSRGNNANIFSNSTADNSTNNLTFDVTNNLTADDPPTTTEYDFLRRCNNQTSKSSVICIEDTEIDNGCLYKSFTFWSFIVLMSIGTIGFNVVNSISDAICCDVVGVEFDYGKQRVWGTIGFGLTALLAGYVVDIFSGSTISYTPAFIIMLVSSALDIFSCVKLKLPIIETPENIIKDIRQLLNNRHVITFITFAVFAGILDSLIIYFLFWYLEDLAIATNTPNVKLIEGLIVAAETLGAEVIFFSISGKILERFGHVHCFSMCFISYALRLGFISIVPSPWWILPIEFFLQGPSYALTYTTIVAYANELAPPGTSATMQGIAAGMDDGVGYAIGSILGGLLYKYVGGRHTLQIFSAVGVFCSIAHSVLHKTILRHSELPDNKNITTVQSEYKSPEAAFRESYQNVD